MTDPATQIPAGPRGPEARQTHRELGISARKAAETRFRLIGLGAVLTAIAFLVILLSTIVGQGLPAFRYHYVSLPADFSGVSADDISSANYNGIFNDALAEVLPSASGRSERRVARGIFASGTDFLIQRQVSADPGLAGGKREIDVPVSDFADLYLKGLVAETKTINPDTAISIERGEGNALRISAESAVFSDFQDLVATTLEEERESLQRQIDAQNRGLRAQQRHLETGGDAETISTQVTQFENQIRSLEEQISAIDERLSNRATSARLDAALPSLLLRIGEGIYKAESVQENAATLVPLVPAGDIGSTVAPGQWSLMPIASPEAQRKFSDAEIAYIEKLRSADLVEEGWSELFFTSGASREPELAGIWGAVVGSFLTLVVTLALSFPIGVAAAVYLEEFAPKNRLTDLIEVNINNLAAVPSIVFGLLGLAVFLNWFGMPRSAPVVGGMVLALMTLPTIIIASRAALRAVPPSIREAALGIGASRLQMVLHHVLPLAMPGILTGTIIGMAQALGETAPLLMIGMVAFIVDIPGGFTDPATVLPVQIFMWADFPEPGFQQKTAAAIMVLLVFLVLMNAIAVLLRKRFERRW